MYYLISSRCILPECRRDWLETQEEENTPSSLPPPVLPPPAATSPVLGAVQWYSKACLICTSIVDTLIECIDSINSGVGDKFAECLRFSGRGCSRASQVGIACAVWDCSVYCRIAVAVAYYADWRTKQRLPEAAVYCCSLAPRIRRLQEGGGGESCHAWQLSYDHRLWHPYYAGTEQVGFSPTRWILVAPSAKRRQMLGVGGVWGISLDTRQCRGQQVQIMEHICNVRGSRALTQTVAVTVLCSVEFATGVCFAFSGETFLFPLGVVFSVRGMRSHSFRWDYVKRFRYVDFEEFGSF